MIDLIIIYCSVSYSFISLCIYLFSKDNNLSKLSKGEKKFLIYCLIVAPITVLPLLYLFIVGNYYKLMNKLTGGEFNR